jgi:crooked neck
MSDELTPQYDPSLSSAWIQWTQVEGAVEDFERVRAIFELAVTQSLDMPEIVWKVSHSALSAITY